MTSKRQRIGRNVRRWLPVPAVALVGLLVAACGDDGGQQSASAAAEPGERTIYVQVTEMDAIRAADGFPEGFPHQTREQYPQYFGDPNDHTDRTGAPGLYLFLQDDGSYRLGSYMFLPSELIAYEGEQITLKLFGVRGGEHQNVLVDPAGNTVNQGVVYRGGIQEVAFTADQAGLWQLICASHGPAQVMNIHVLPR